MCVCVCVCVCVFLALCVCVCVCHSIWSAYTQRHLLPLGRKARRSLSGSGGPSPAADSDVQL